MPPLGRFSGLPEVGWVPVQFNRDSKMFNFSLLCVLLCCLAINSVQSVTNSGYFQPSSGPEAGLHTHFVQNHRRIPRDVMVDLINDLGFKLLAIHNENNDNNIALSPYGALSVLVALGEGVEGAAAQEILHSTKIPDDISLVRIGLRDIHRHLKSYFIPKEGFLGGLTFSDDNVTLNEEYEEILRFYGYDIESFNNALYPDPATTLRPDITTIGTTSLDMEDRDSTAPMPDFEELSTLSQSTSLTPQEVEDEIPEVTMVNEIPISSTTEDFTTEPTILPTEMSTKASEETTTLAPQTTEEETTVLVTESTSPDVKEETTTLAPQTTTEIKEETTVLVTESTSPELKEETTTLAPQTTTEVNEETTILTSTQGLIEKTSTTELPQETTILSEVTLPSLLETSTEVAQEPTILVETLPSFTESNEEVSTTPTLPDLTTITSEETTSTSTEQESNEIDASNKKRSVRSVLDYVIARYYDDHYIPSRPSLLNNYTPEAPSTFLVYNKYRESKINFMKYDTVLPFHYISHLDAMALTFPLDSTNYYLLLILPVQDQAIDKLVCDLRLNTNLKYIIDNMRYQHVVATIPSFMLQGYVVLTSTLQKLGIKKVFEPRQADFSPMTPKPDIYVKNIEQAITVTIRNYVDPTKHEPYRNLHQFDPIHFKADHPFLYFVIDSELHVALMAGKIVNPLNSRIR